MKILNAAALVLLLAVMFGCASVKVVPEMVEHGSINAADNSLSIDRNNVSVKVSVDEVGINAYNLENTVASFRVTVKNSSAQEVAFSADSFVLVDDRGMQYSVLTPEKMRDLLKKDSYYLMPYPYVGFYYLEDFQKTTFYNRFNSSLPYYYEMYPQDLFTKSLPMSTIIPGMSIEGLLYFKIDMTAHQAVKLYVYRKGASKSAQPEYVFPFKIVK